MAGNNGGVEVRNWRVHRFLLSTDHKVIGAEYFLLSIISVLIGTGLSMLMRFQLGWPGQRLALIGSLFPAASRDGAISPELYLSMVSMHGTIMIFFVMTMAPLNAFGSYFLPLQIGAGEMAFPRLGRVSLYLSVAALGLLIAAFFAESGVIGPISGWTAYPPLSAVGKSGGPGQGPAIIFWLAGVMVFCLGTILQSANFITTVFVMRARGMSFLRMPLTCWGWFTAAVLVVASFPVLIAAGLMLLMDHSAGTSFFVPSGLVIGQQPASHTGGMPILWQHLFWFFGHPEVYIAILPGMGLVSQVLSCFSRRPVFGYRAMVYSMLAIGLLGFFVWGHHMFVSGISPYAAMGFSLLTLTIAVPSAIKTFNWIGTIWGGSIRFTSSMLFAIGFVSVFITGGLTGLFVGQAAIDMQLHDTYFVTGHFHLVMGAAVVFGLFSATYYWFPKMTGRMMSERLGKLHFLLSYAGMHAVFIPFLLMGIAGAPRRYSSFMELAYLARLQPLNRFISYAAFLTAAAQMIFFFNLVWSYLRGRRAERNPWHATTLEWSAESPPSRWNFEGGSPVVYRGAYEYSVPGAPVDFVMQDDAGGNGH